MAKRKQTTETNGRTADGRFAKGHTNGYKPGQSGNPGGRRRSLISEAYRELLQQSLPGDPTRTVADAVATVVLQAAMGGDIAACRELCDRTEGRPRQALDVNATVMDWREVAKQYGLSEEDVIREARQLIESADAAGAAGGH